MSLYFSNRTEDLSSRLRFISVSGLDMTVTSCKFQEFANLSNLAVLLYNPEPVMNGINITTNLLPVIFFRGNGGEVGFCFDTRFRFSSATEFGLK